MNPLLLASLFLSVGSAAANMVGANRAQKARDSALAAERIRQRQYDAEAQGLNTQSQDRYEDYSGKQEEKAQQLGDYFAQETTAGDPNVQAASVMPSASSDVIINEIAKKQAGADQFGNQQANALGTLRSFGDLLGDTSRLQARDASLIGQIGGFKRGSSSIVPYELEAAAQKGGGFRLLGDLLSGASAITGGMAGAPGAASAGAGAAPGSFRAAQEVGMKTAAPSLFARMFQF